MKGSFSAAKCGSSSTTCAVGSNPVALAAVDLNGDGIVDLAVANVGSSTLSVLLGTGKASTGAFQNALTYSLGSGANPVSIAAGAHRRTQHQRLGVGKFARRNGKHGKRYRAAEHGRQFTA